MVPVLILSPGHRQLVPCYQANARPCLFTKAARLVIPFNSSDPPCTPASLQNLEGLFTPSPQETRAPTIAGELSDIDIFLILNRKTFEDGDGNVYSTYGHLMNGDEVTVWRAKKNDDQDEFAVKQMESDDLTLEETFLGLRIPLRLPAYVTMFHLRSLSFFQLFQPA
ncbi:MAG: hypothetical protein JOS17DRAFT_778597 [Linnemannia elongata]|nr:MAG: hypothetical protein JOS17DRAFT_778597 [Linnemannia elongata]